MSDLLGNAFYLAVFAFGYGFLSSAFHLLASGARMLRGKPSRFDWLVAGRSLVVIIGLPAIALVYGLSSAIAKVAAAVDSETNAAIVELNVTWIALVMGAFLLLLLPVLLPIVEVIVRRRGASLSLAFASVLSLPLIAGAFLTIVNMFAYEALGGAPESPRTPAVDVAYEEYPELLATDAYVIRREWKQTTITRAWGLPAVRGRFWSVDEFVKHRNALWLETAINRITFGLVDWGLGHLSELEFAEKAHVSFIVQTFQAIFSFGIFGCGAAAIQQLSRRRDPK